MAPVATFSRTHCHAHAPYTTPRKQSEIPWPAQDHLHKVQLAYQLNSCQLPNMPLGFPFPHRQLLGHGRHHVNINEITLDPYEFHETLPTQNYTSGQAIIRFSGRSVYDRDPYLTWQVYLPSTDRSTHRNPSSRASIAKVYVSVALYNTYFWHALVHDPSTILRALAISLEIGKPISIELLDANTVVYQTLGSKERKNYLVVKIPSC
ncbi:hypothetical protein H0H93_004339 [Arthromyces matolae]|nr:hypothetical protein H0H93_004339 [Arthromyces matolae]